MHTASNSWEEMVIIWNTRPSEGNLVTSVDAVLGQNIIDVTSAVSGSGQVTFVLINQNDNKVIFQSKESAGAAPALEVTFD